MAIGRQLDGIGHYLGGVLSLGKEELYLGLLVEGLASVPLLVLAGPVGIAWHTARAAVVQLEGPLIEGDTALEELSGELRQALVRWVARTQHRDSLVQVLEDEASHLITGHTARGLEDQLVVRILEDLRLVEDGEVAVGSQHVEVEHGADDVGLADVVLDVVGVPRDRPRLVLRQYVAEEDIDIADRGDIRLPRAPDLPLVIAEGLSVGLGASLVVRAVIIEGDPCIPATTTMPLEDGGVVVDGEGAQLVGRVVVGLGPDLVQRIAVEDVARSGSQGSQC